MTATDRPAIRPALDGITVLDLSHVLLGPYCTMLLSRFGADVIKIEPPTGDPLRSYRTANGAETASVGLFNSGKRSLRLDLKHELGRDLFLRLVEGADVVVENFGPTTMERLGLGYETLSARNPQVILASGRGYGLEGPYRDFLAMDLVIQAVTGVLSTTGFPDNPPVKAGVPIADMTAGIHLMAGVMVALYQRSQTGRGQRVVVSMHDSLLPTLSSPLASWLDNGGEWPERTGNRHSGLAVSPYNVYPAADGWMAILSLTDGHWRSLCKLMDRADLADEPRFTTNTERATRMDEVDALVAAWTKRHTRRELFDMLGPAGVPAAPVQNLGEVLVDPQVSAQDMLKEVSDESGRSALTFGNPIRLESSPQVDVTPAPEIGSDSREILINRLGLSSAEVEDLQRAGVI